MNDQWALKWGAAVVDVIGDEDPGRTIRIQRVRGTTSQACNRRIAMHVMRRLFQLPWNDVRCLVSLTSHGAMSARRQHAVAHEIARDRPWCNPRAVKEARECDDWTMDFLGAAVDELLEVNIEDAGASSVPTTEVGQ